MRNIIAAAILAVSAISCPAALQAQAIRDSFRPGELWPDNNGVPINAHGGGILRHGGWYYWFGEHKIGGRAGNVAHVGVHCYKSGDLYNWQDAGIALRVSDDPASPIAKGRIIERPKVIYCKKTGKFVMWFHLEPYNRETREGMALNVEQGAMSGVAVSDTPEGPYRFVHGLHPCPGRWPVNVKPLHKTRPWPGKRRKYSQKDPAEHTDSVNILGRDMRRGQQARDMTLFADDDGKAYHIYASEENSTLHIAELTDDYLSHTGKYMRIFANRYHEAPAMFKHGGKYYMMMSGCTGWKPNAARSAVADSVFGEWRELGNPCIGPGSDVTFRSQSTFILPAGDRLIYMGDRWKASNAIDGRYVWLPIEWEDGRFVIRWKDEWRL